MAFLLISAIRVCKRWNTVINTSAVIQRKLYFKPVLVPQNSESPPQPIVNPLLKERFGGCFFDTGILDGYLRRANSFYAMPCTGSPWREKGNYGLSFRYGPLVGDMKPQDAREFKVACLRFTRKDASWRRMLVSQPPPPCLGYIMVEEGRDSGYFPRRPIRLETALFRPGPSPGLRMGTLYDAVQDRTCHHTGMSMWFRVVWDKPKPPFATANIRECCQGLLRRASVVVEFYDAFGWGWVDHREPRNSALFDDRFQSEAYRHVEFDLDRTFYGAGGLIRINHSMLIQ